MRFLVDESLSPRLAHALADAGHEAVHVRDFGLQSAPDPVVFEKAREEQSVLVTADTDFGTLLAFEHATAPSVILFRRTKQRRTEQQVLLLLSNLDRIEEALVAGCVAVFEDERVRLRALPIGSETL